MFGYTAAEAVGKPVTMLIPPDRLDEEPKIIQSLQRGERVDHFETIRMRKDGTPLEISLTISPIADGTGRIIGASKIARDITERKRTEKELRGYRDLLEAKVAQRTAELKRSTDRMALNERMAAVGTLAAGLAHDMKNALLPPPGVPTR